MTKETNNITKPIDTTASQTSLITPSTIVSLYEFFDSCMISNSWSPGNPSGPDSRGIRYPYNKKEIIGFDTLKPKTCIVRNGLFKPMSSIVDSQYANFDNHNFYINTNIAGPPLVYLIFKSDSLFISSKIVGKYESKGYELRAVRK